MLGESVDNAALAREMRGEPVPPSVEPQWFEVTPLTDRDEILSKALAYLSKRGVPYVPLAIEEDIQTSYEDDALEEFRETVRGWIKALAQAKQEAA